MNIEIVFFLALSNLILIASLMFLVKMNDKYRRSVKKWRSDDASKASSYLKSLSNMEYMLSVLSDDLHDSILSSLDNEVQRKKEIERVFQKFIYSIITQTKFCFDNITNSNSAVTIKSLEKNAEDVIVVKVLARDQGSWVIRENNKDRPEFFNLPKAGILNYIHDNHNITPVLICNGESAVDRFPNANPNWRTYYTSVCAVAVTGGDDNVIGFLCIDTLDGVFTKELSIELAMHISRILSSGFEILVDSYNYLSMEH